MAAAIFVPPPLANPRVSVLVDFLDVENLSDY